MIRGIGIDIVEIERIEALWQRSGARFLAKVFTDAEAAYCAGLARPAESLAARFCAKEAVLKCLGTGWAQGLTLRQVEVVRETSGAVSVRLHGAAAARAAELGIRRWHLSLSHSGRDAVAMAVAEH